MNVNETYQGYYWTYGTGYERNSDGTYNLTGVSTLLYSSNYSDLEGKYLVSSSASSNSSSTDTQKTTTNIASVIKVESATNSNLMYKSSNAPAEKTEAVLSSTEDDYGTSYYFRGAVENNYVVFANMCWRIVRVVGDGSIKLVLYNYNSSSCTTTGNSNAFARHTGTTYTVKFNEIYNQAGIGLMYGSGGTYALNHANNTNSTFLTNLVTWYNRDNKFFAYEHLLADTIWCNDKSLASGPGWGNNDTVYGPSVRVARPTLICPNDSVGGKLSKFTVNDNENGNGKLTKKIGALTMDEVVYAGGKFSTANTACYLNKNASSNSWWTLSPGHRQNNGEIHSYQIGINLNVIKGMIGAVTTALRPAVSLVSTTEITSGNGTSENPFIVKT